MTEPDNENYLAYADGYEEGHADGWEAGYAIAVDESYPELRVTDGD